MIIDIIHKIFKHKKKENNKVTCTGCIYLYYNNDGSAACYKDDGIHNDHLEYYNKQNIRPCKKIKLDL